MAKIVPNDKNCDEIVEGKLKAKAAFPNAPADEGESNLPSGEKPNAPTKYDYKPVEDEE